ncbi:MAG: hypothetical protein PUP93_20145 [Rhizonema sp. NSF051]|nr:hypothetical protein [Rhizonema sp. NSF051]
MEERPNVGPFDPLLDVQGVKGPQDIFGNISSSISIKFSLRTVRFLCQYT